MAREHLREQQELIGPLWKTWGLTAMARRGLGDHLFLPPLESGQKAAPFPTDPLINGKNNANTLFATDFRFFIFLCKPSTFPVSYSHFGLKHTLCPSQSPGSCRISLLLLHTHFIITPDHPSPSLSWIFQDCATCCHSAISRNEVCWFDFTDVPFFLPLNSLRASSLAHTIETVFRQDSLPSVLPPDLASHFSRITPPTWNKNVIGPRSTQKPLMTFHVLRLNPKLFNMASSILPKLAIPNFLFTSYYFPRQVFTCIFMLHAFAHAVASPAYCPVCLARSKTNTLSCFVSFLIFVQLAS